MMKEREGANSERLVKGRSVIVVGIPSWWPRRQANGKSAINQRSALSAARFKVTSQSRASGLMNCIAGCIYLTFILGVIIII